LRKISKIEYLLLKPVYNEKSFLRALYYLRLA
jgi:hypothetical protein